MYKKFMNRSKVYQSMLTLGWIGCLAGAPVKAADQDVQIAPEDLAARIAARPANEGRLGRMLFTMTSKSGATREREASMVHSEHDGVIRIAIFFSRPSMISGTAFLSHDYKDGIDQNWLFLPATDRVRRLPSSDRGDYFMGTDLTYGDVKDDFKFPAEDWIFELCEQSGDPVPGKLCLAGQVRNSPIANETGYSRFTAEIDPQTDFPVDIQYWDADGELLKRIVVEDFAQVGGVWTAMRFVVDQLQTGHRTLVRFENMRYAPDLDPSVFEPDSLSYGGPSLD